MIHEDDNDFKVFIDWKGAMNLCVEFLEEVIMILDQNKSF
jgi:hypothetical protein